jgi:hypothetical protein
MKKLFMVLLCVLAVAGFAMAQTYTEGSGLTGMDKLGAHQNGGRGCVGCHAPHSGALGNGGNAAAGGGPVTDVTTGDETLWGQDLGPLYTQTIGTGNAGAYDITFPANSSDEPEITTGIMMCLSCHDGNLAKGAMMTNQAYEPTLAGFPSGYGPNPIPTLLGNDGVTPAGNYENDHPIGPKATLGAVGVASRLLLSNCGTGTNNCLEPNTSNSAFMAFYNHYGAFNITQKVTGTYNSGGRTTGVVIPTGATDATTAYVVCTTCHTPHTMYTFSGNVRNSATSGTYPTYFFIAAPYNPGAPIAGGTKASSATQFCRQCHFTGAGGSNEGSGILGVDTQF